MPETKTGLRIQKFRKKPVVVEAMQFNNDADSYNLLHWANEHQFEMNAEFVSWENGKLLIPTLEGTMTASPGDWIIIGTQGEIYPCKPNSFADTFDAV